MIMNQFLSVNKAIGAMEEPISGPIWPAFFCGPRTGLASPPAIPILLRKGTLAGEKIVEPSRSFLGSGEEATVCGLLLYS